MLHRRKSCVSGKALVQYSMIPGGSKGNHKLLIFPNKQPRNLGGKESKAYSWAQQLDDVLSPETPTQPPERCIFSSSEKGLLAMAHRGRGIYIFDQSLAYVGHSHWPGINTIDAMAFNPTPEIQALVVSSPSHNGALFVFDTQTTETKHCRPEVYADTLSCSPDGRSLVSGNCSGTIELYDFDGVDGFQLTLIYRINTYKDGIRATAFSSNSHRVSMAKAASVESGNHRYLSERNLFTLTTVA